MDTNFVSSWLYDCKKDVRDFNYATIYIWVTKKKKKEKEKGKNVKLILGTSKILCVIDCYTPLFKKLE